MTTPADTSPDPWADAVLAAALFAIDPPSIGGVVLHGAPGPVRDAWFAHLHALLPRDAPVRRAPLHITTDRLLGGLDVGATLALRTPVLERGLLAAADGGIVIAAMAERWSATDAAHIAASLDCGAVVFERDGFRARLPTRFGLIAIDEGTPQDARPPTTWRDRLAFDIDLDAISIHETNRSPPDVDAVDAARKRLTALPSVDRKLVASMCAAAVSLGISSLRAPLLALAVARLHAAYAGRTAVTETDAAIAARLVLAPRATMLPEVAAEPDRQDEAASSRDPSSGEPPADAEAPPADLDATALQDLILAAARASVPAGLLELSSRRNALAATDGHVGDLRRSARRGKCVGVHPTSARSNARINVLATLRAAAPWQKLRQRPAANWRLRPLSIRRDDLRANRFKQRSGSTIVFAVDASGSAALHRLAEAKGAVETLLAECYVRRDHVALVSFRGSGAEVLLPRSKSLARAKRALAGLPGGGGTPLASGLDAAAAVALQARRTGDTPLLVLMTDGRANVTRTGQGGRPEAQEQAVKAARHVRNAGIDTLLIDTAPQPNAFAARIAAEMGGRYVQLPHADAHSISRIISSERLSSGP